ncbi:hypothetical protein ACRS6B_19345 [Nocardia asteroides]
MTEASIAYRWTRSEFLRAWEAGAFDHRVELVEGEVWPVVIGSWHGRAVFRIARKLPTDGVEVIGWSPRTVIYEHTEPTTSGYRTRKEYRPGDDIPVHYSGTTIPVDDLLFPR